MALSDWETSKRLFFEADGVLPAPDLERLTLIDMLPAEVNTYVTMHLDVPEYDILQKLRHFVLEYTKVLLSQKRKSRGLHLAERQGEDDERQSEQPREEDSEESEHIAGLAEFLNLGALEPQQADKILALLRAVQVPKMWD